MKRNPKKLTLNRETILNLEGDDLRRAGGASDHCTSSLCIIDTQCGCAQTTLNTRGNSCGSCGVC